MSGVEAGPRGAAGSATVAPTDDEVVTHWLARCEAALRAGDAVALAALFVPDGHWRDVLAFTWSITPGEGASAIAAALVAAQSSTAAHGFALARGRTPPRRVPRAGYDVIEALFDFETRVGRGVGVVRLLVDQPDRAVQLLTTLHELKGHEEQVGARRPTGGFRHFGGPNWKEVRAAAQAYTDHEPDVLIVGGGQAGLSLSAVLGRIGVDNLVIDRLPRVGDCWRLRYHALALHNDTNYNHLPYLPFPPSWPIYLPKDMVADWFET